MRDCRRSSTARKPRETQPRLLLNVNRKSQPVCHLPPLSISPDRWKEPNGFPNCRQRRDDTLLYLVEGGWMILRHRRGNNTPRPVLASVIKTYPATATALIAFSSLCAIMPRCNKKSIRWWSTDDTMTAVQCRTITSTIPKISGLLPHPPNRMHQIYVQTVPYNTPTLWPQYRGCKVLASSHRLCAV